LSLDQTASVNATVEGENSTLNGSPTHRVIISLQDQQRSGLAVVIAEDLAGNRDTLQLELGITLPELSPAPLEMLSVRRNEKRVERVTIRNNSPNLPIVLDSLQLLPQSRFRIIGFGTGGASREEIPPGSSFEVEIFFQSALRGSFADTLFLWIDCEIYRIPLQAVMAQPLISMKNLDFFQVLIGTGSCDTLTLSNSGTDTLDISAIELGGEYRFDTADIPDLPRKIPPGEDLEIPICFFPRRLGLQLGKVTVLSSAVNSDSGFASLLGIGVNSYTAVGFDGEENALQLAIVPQGDYLTVVATDRSRPLGVPSLYTIKGEQIQILDIDQIGEGWWQLQLPGRLTSGIYIFLAKAPTLPSFRVKFVVLE
ncbi:MAG: hypothetical protein AB7H80_04530, partial [Candidatus Kapaibacterium sp.]